MSSVMAILFFWGLARVPLAQGVALAFVAPLIALYLAALMLKEKIERRAIFASLLGFAGVARHLRRAGGGRHRAGGVLGRVSILASAVFYAWNIVLMRQQALVAEAARGRLLHRPHRRACYLPLRALARRAAAARSNIRRSSPRPCSASAR